MAVLSVFVLFCSDKLYRRSRLRENELRFILDGLYLR